MLNFAPFDRTYRVVILLLLIFPRLGLSSIQTSRSPELRPVDTFLQNIQKSHHSKRAKVLKKAYDALKDDEDYAAAIKWATPLLGDETFSDYACWIASSAHRAQAQDQLDEKHYSAAITHAQKAAALSLRIEEKSPYSPFLKYLNRDLAQAEMAQGDGNWGNHKWTAAQRPFESAFQRFQSKAFSPKPTRTA